MSCIYLLASIVMDFSRNELHFVSDWSVIFGLVGLVRVELDHRKAKLPGKFLSHPLIDL